MKEEDFLNHLGQRIRNLRNSKSWTLLDLSALTGIDISDLSKIELGYTNSKIYTLFKISQALGITVSKLLEFK